MSDDGDGIDWGAVMVVVLVGLITAFVGMQVAITVTDEQLEQMEEQEVTDTCMGVFGCGQDIPGMIGVSFVVTIAAIVMANVVSLRKSHNADSDELQEVKRLYVEGDIHILELEDRLDDVMDDTDGDGE